jgi:hypothetical protein
MTLMSRTSAGALEAESLVRLTGDISVLEARRPDELSRCFCLFAQSVEAVSRLAFCLADLSLTEEVRVQRCTSDAASDGLTKGV